VYDSRRGKLNNAAISRDASRKKRKLAIKSEAKLGPGMEEKGKLGHG